MLPPSHALERQLLPFIAFQGAYTTLIGFSGILMYQKSGVQGTVIFIAWMLAFAAISIISPFVLGRWLGLRGKRLVRISFVIPAIALYWADGNPMLLGVAAGVFLGCSWAARHWLELSLLSDGQRDHYASQVTVITVISGLLATALVSGLLTVFQESPTAVYASYGVMAIVASVWAARTLPQTPVMHWEQPLEVVRQPAFKACLPLFFLESGMFGVGLVMGASGAVQALGQASHYGWVSSIASVFGAVSLYVVRRKRHSTNRVRWMGLACLGIVAAQVLLGSCVWVPQLFIVHLLLLACVQPFWAASEHVLNQRALDLKGALADRIVVREAILGVFRLIALGCFWLVVRHWSPQATLVLGTFLMALAALSEWLLGRAWLR